MDELIHHCVRELAFDGELGCDVSRLREFIQGFYARNSSTAAQKVDDAYCAYVWAVIAQQPTVRVGMVPPGGATEVHIAPQASAKRKAKTKGEKPPEALPAPEGLQIIPDAAIRPLEELRAEYGEGLRIAVDSDTAFTAITGSHIRHPKLTSMVYTALQFISRGRDEGISVIDLGKKSGYDQKTCFYLIKQLVDLDLVVKRRKPGVSTNICVHKYFFDRSEVWKQVLKEEAQAAESQQRGGPDESKQESDEEDVQDTTPSTVQFDPIDSRHLSSLPLVRARITKLLQSSPHGIHSSTNVLVRIGFANPTKSDRRFFRTLIRELLDQGVIEKVQVMHPDKQRFPNRKTTCIRLVHPHEVPLAEDQIPAVPLKEIAEVGNPLKVDLTIYKQIINLLDESGTKGMTMNELSAALCNFDKRTIELLLTRLEHDPPPPHLGDLGIAQQAENYGRERRYKYYTVAHFHTIAARENFEDHQYKDVDLDQAGGFMQVKESAFYDDESALKRYVDNFKTIQDANVADTAKKSKGKQRVWKNPILPDGTVKRGRPRKYPVSEDAATSKKASMKRKRTEESTLEERPELSAGDIQTAETPPPKRKRGRPPKQRIEPAVAACTTLEGTISAGPSVSADMAPPEAVPKRRGRPPKQKAAPVVSADAGVDQTSSVQPEPVQRKRGRPRKSIPQPEPVTAEQPNDRMDEEPAPDAISVAVSDGDSPDGLSQMLVNADNSLDMSTAVDESLISMDTSMAADESFTTHQTVPSDLSSASISASAAQLLRPLPRSCQPLQSANVPSPSIGTHVIATEQHPIDLQSDAEEADVVSDQARRPVTANVGPPLSAPVSASLGVPLPAAGGSLDIPLSDVCGSAPPALAGIPIDPMLLDTHDQVTSLTDGVLHQDVSQDRSSSAASLYIAENNVSSQSNTAKRPNPGATTPAPSAKRAKTDSETENRYHSKVKLTQSRREKEFMRVITDAGGIVNVSSKGFYEAYSAVIEAITKAGEIASTLPGTRIDKRTVEATLSDLESRQKVKVITTSVKTSTGGHRSVRVAYLPDITESDLNTFLSNLRIQQFPTSAPIKSIEEPTVYGGKPSKLRSATTSAGFARDVLQGKNPATMQQLVQSGDTAVREALLGEKSTLAQLYGYIPGKAARARELHLWTVKLFESKASSPHIVSTEQRVVSFSLYVSELPISLYCAFVSTLWQSDELPSLLASDEGRMTPIVKVAPLIRDGLQIARSRSRERLLELLYMLCCLRLVDPLQPTKSDDPAVRCARGETSPSAFDIVPVDSWSPTTAPVFWRFNTIVPLHLWALSEHSPPPFWKNVTVESPGQCIEYWRELQYVSIHTEHCKHIVVATVDESVHAKIGKTLKRSNSWIDRYVLSWYQTEYLRQNVDQPTGSTPLQDQENGAARIQHISWVVCAPTGVVEEFFTKAHRKHRKEQKKMQERAEQRIEEKKAREAKSKAILAQKAEEARLQRELDWDAMVSNVHPEPLKGSAAARVRRIRSQFLQSSAKNRKKWETQIAKAIEEANMAAKQVLSTNRLSPPRMTLGIVPLPPVVANASEKTVEEIISQQGPPLVPCIQEAKEKTKKKGKGRKKDGLLPAEPSRRHRFQWNRDFDELARDAYVIIKARCRGHGRLEFAALQQAFPAVPRNSVRQRVVSLKEVPGAATYMQRLEDKWYEVWVQHRGTPNLPDADPESPTNFDLVAHIKFLRNHVDKNALRVGFLQMEKESTIVLPGTIDQLESSWNIIEKPPIAPKWDFIWTGVAEEGREKQFVQQAFTMDANEIPPTQCQHSESVYVAEAALKMVMGTPNDTYDAQAAAVFLSSVGENAVQAASKDLLARGVFSKIIRDPTRSRPGRALKISDSNQNALGGSLSQDIFQDASALEDLLGQDEDNAWREWSLLSSDGDMAAMLELVLDNKIEFKVDTTHAQERRATVDWNSKKADDDDIETALLARASIPLASSSPPQAAEDSAQEEQIQAVKSFGEDQSDEHGRTASGEMAFCRFTSNSLIDCAACLHDSKVSILQEAGEHEEMVISALLEELNSARSVGISRERLLTNTGPSSTIQASAIINRLINASIPLAYWAGYTKIILVSAAHIRPWAVCLSDTDGRSVMLFPRRWIDITGRRINDVWEAALRAVLGIVVFRPGICQAEIRWRLRSVYDRWEVNDVLHHIREEGYANRRVGEPLCVPDSWPADEEEERSAFWFLRDDKSWYHI
ncbi:uncharacterized protein LAESUDRAFT_726133 [Laetiporus sulphureus 93-53]|uniref:Uncharacterized protein n=1 Tax=Laetiporus sulphureus 93-53 TaxID=1314785 RepID=A0A165E601_9APHY|nr:uncharacterized protein LAESUDRAFT_726133 [Laetiporus sulphureus 93-53]KZT06305.1 hypothetical protein LAESUDRAFT_726133 [Laetiporus sulphureus 93-53]